MKLHGQQIIGQQLTSSGESKFQAYNPATKSSLDPFFSEATSEEISDAFDLAEKAVLPFGEVSRDGRADFLETVADEILALGDVLIDRATQETGLPTGRITGERGRTMNQLKLFAAVVRKGDFLEISIDKAQPDRSPFPKPDIRMMNIPIGPVAIFGASNFPLAFSVAGGDTASALAAGCPVVVKAHPSHPGTSELVGRAIMNAARKTGMPQGIFSMVQGSGVEVGQQMVKNRFAKAVAFTGSFRGGKALFDLAASREEPIPCFAEMGSINPVFLLPERLLELSGSIASQYVDSVNLGAGQFCTNPGIVLAVRGSALDKFVDTAIEKLKLSGGSAMLNSGIKANFEKNLNEIAGQDGISMIAKGNDSQGCVGQPHLLKTSGSAFIANKKFQEEIFGPASIIVECKTMEELEQAAKNLTGNLTATLQATPSDLLRAKSLIKILERKVGRLVVNGFPTGVEVCHSMMHGGPFPSTTDSRFTSVGTSAIKRFLRPISYQNFPLEILISELANENDSAIWRKVNGELSNQPVSD